MINIIEELQQVINELMAEAEQLPDYEEIESLDDMAMEFSAIWEDR